MQIATSLQAKRKHRSTNIKEQLNKTTLLLKEIEILGANLKLPQGYTCQPSIPKIIADGFKAKELLIKSPSGTSIKWKGTVDLSKLGYSLAEVLEFTSSSVEVYKPGQITPAVGTQLNRTCVATLWNGKKFVKDLQCYTQAIRKMTRICQAQGVKLLSLDIETGEFKIQIPHFSKYRFVDDSDDELPASAQHLQRSLPAVQGPRQHNSIPYQPSLNDTLTNPRYVQPEPMKHMSQPVLASNKKSLFPTTSQHQIFEQQATFDLREIKDYTQETSKTIFGGSDALFVATKKDSSYLLEMRQLRKDAAGSKQILKLINSISTNPFQDEDLLARIAENVPIARNVLALTQILFKDKKVALQGNGLRRETKPHTFRKQDCLKVWFESVCRTTPCRSAEFAVKQLSQRRIDEFVDYLLKQNQIFLAELVARLEDPFLAFQFNNSNFIFQALSQPAREEKSAEGIAARVRHVLLDLLQSGGSSFRQQCWVIRLAVGLWYSFNSNFSQHLTSVLKDALAELSNSKNFSQPHTFICPNEFRVFRTYSIYENRSPPQIFVEPKALGTADQIFVSWILSNTLSRQESRTYQKNSYNKFRLRQLRQLLGQTQDQATRLQLIQLDNYVSPQAKEILSRQFCRDNSDAKSSVEYLVYNAKDISPSALQHQSTRSSAIAYLQYKFENDFLMKLTEKQEYLRLLQSGYNSDSGGMLIETHFTAKSSLYRLYLELYFDQIALRVQVINQALAILQNINQENNLKLKEIIRFLLEKIIQNDTQLAYELKQPENVKINQSHAKYSTFLDLYNRILQKSREYTDLYKRLRIMHLPQFG